VVSTQVHTLHSLTFAPPPSIDQIGRQATMAEEESKKQPQAEAFSSGGRAFNPTHTSATILCPLCGMPFEANASNMCADCLRGQVNLASEVQPTQPVIQCKGCHRWQHKNNKHVSTPRISALEGGCCNLLWLDGLDSELLLLLCCTISGPHLRAPLLRPTTTPHTVGGGRAGVWGAALAGPQAPAWAAGQGRWWWRQTVRGGGGVDLDRAALQAVRHPFFGFFPLFSWSGTLVCTNTTSNPSK
jgi:hypothetical protein